MREIRIRSNARGSDRTGIFKFARILEGKRAQDIRLREGELMQETGAVAGSNPIM